MKNKKKIEVGTKEFTNGMGYFFDIWKKIWKIKHNISIQKISEEYQREDEGREEGKNGNLGVHLWEGIFFWYCDNNYKIEEVQSICL